jgi:hypothetical protein
VVRFSIRNHHKSGSRFTDTLRAGYPVLQKKERKKERKLELKGILTKKRSTRQKEGMPSTSLLEKGKWNRKVFKHINITFFKIFSLLF